MESHICSRGYPEEHDMFLLGSCHAAVAINECILAPFGPMRHKRFSRRIHGNTTPFSQPRPVPSDGDSTGSLFLCRAEHLCVGGGVMSGDRMLECGKNIFVIPNQSLPGLTVLDRG